MTDLPSGASVDSRLRDYLAAELDRAERDFPLLPRPAPQSVGRRLSAGFALAVVAVVAVVVIGPRLLPATMSGPGAIQIGSDGLPVSFDGEPVLRGDQITARSASSGSFLAGGTLVLGSDPCPNMAEPSAGPSAEPCDEWWKLAGAAGAGPQFALNGLTAAAGFVRTSGALTVVRVERFAGGSSGPSLCTTCEGTLTVEAVAWRKPTRGPIPDNASPPQGGPIYPALVPDFVPAWARDGTTIAGYVPKAYLIESGGVVPGTPSNPPQAQPDPVFAEDLTTLVGYMVPGVGFVPIGASPVASPDPDGGAVASAAPSAEVSDATASPAADPAGASGAIPVDPAVAAVSLSNPPADATRAFEVCLVREIVGRYGIAVITGLGRIGHASDAPRYARLSPRNPELQSDRPAWVVQFQGDIRLPGGGTYLDPTCIVVDGGDGGFFATGGVRDTISGAVSTPLPDDSTPDLALPRPNP